MQHRRILLADDDQGVREVIRFVLALDEHVIVEAANGREALKLFQPAGFDLVITDFAMPGMDGRELAARIRDLAPAQPILMISGHTDPLSRPASTVNRFLSKPFSLVELRQAVDSLLDRQQEGGGEPPRDPV